MATTARQQLLALRRHSRFVQRLRPAFRRLRSCADAPLCAQGRSELRAVAGSSPVSKRSSGDGSPPEQPQPKLSSQLKPVVRAKVKTAPPVRLADLLRLAPGDATLSAATSDGPTEPSRQRRSAHHTPTHGRPVVDSAALGSASPHVPQHTGLASPSTTTEPPPTPTALSLHESTRSADDVGTAAGPVGAVPGLRLAQKRKSLVKGLATFTEADVQRFHSLRIESLQVCCNGHCVATQWTCTIHTQESVPRQGGASARGMQDNRRRRLRVARFRLCVVVACCPHLRRDC